MLEESEMCTVPGGLARVKKQFEKDKIASSSNTFTQYQHQNRSEQVILLLVKDKSCRAEMLLFQCWYKTHIPALFGGIFVYITHQEW